MTDLERHNLSEIHGLNQRGGRMLSFVDLIEAGTMSDEMCAFCLCAIANGASFLTAARPGGVGKTTVLAALLGFLPPDTKIVTVDSRAVIAKAKKEDPSIPRCCLPHELGSGMWYGYIWGDDVAELFNLKEGNRRVASCIHVDTIGELRDVLTSPPLNVAEAHFRDLELALFMTMEGGVLRSKRRVCSLCEAAESGEHHELFRWDAGRDVIRRDGDSTLFSRIERHGGKEKAELDEEYKHCLRFVRDVAGSSVSDFEDVREKVVEFYAEAYK
ncbi:MAG: hypothetical protein GXP25_02955 [Planctomycetes bacterium]|nr:hypothetical protein [Planctomycetota bacterium]